MIDRRVLTDHTGPVQMKLDEASVEGKLFVEGKCGQVDKPTANGRTYPRSIMEREIKKMSERITNGTVVGSLDHPGDGKSRLKDASHIIHKVWMSEDGSMNLRAEIVEECDNGRNLAAFMRRGAKIGMSSRGMGSTRQEGDRQVVNEDYKLSTFDFVADPAVSDAVPAAFVEDVNVEAITPEMIRNKFPKQVQAIEEEAHAVAQRVTEMDLESEHGGLIESALDEYRGQIRHEVYEEAKTELVSQFSGKLVKGLQEARAEIEQEVRKEIEADSTYVGAKATLTRLAEMLMPYKPAIDVQQILSDKEEQLGEAESKLEALKEKAQGLAELSRKLAFENHFERQIAEREDAPVVRQLMGDLGEIETTEEYQSRLEGVLEKADDVAVAVKKRQDEAHERDQRIIKNLTHRHEQMKTRLKEHSQEVSEKFQGIASGLQERLDSLEEENTKLRDKNSVLNDSMSEAQSVINRLENFNYAERRTVGHPNRDTILEDVRHGRLDGRKSINDVAESSDLAAEEPGGVNERVRRVMSRGREFASADLTESQSSREIPDLAELGLSVKDLLPLGRIRKN